MTRTSKRTAATMIATASVLWGALAQAQPASSDSQSAEPAPAPSAPAQSPQNQLPEVDSSQSPSNAESPLPAGEGSQPASNSRSSIALPAEPQSTPRAERPAPKDDGPRVLFPSGDQLRLGGYGGLDVGYSRLAGRDAVLVCGGGALLVNHAFSIGLAGCGLPSRISGQAYGNVTHESGDRLEFGYGGVVAGFQFFPKEVYNVSVSAMVGGGGASIVNRNDSQWSDNSDRSRVKTTDPVFVAEPRLTAYLNLTRWARVGAFAGYRLVGGVNMRNLSSADLSGPVAGGTVQFGWF